MSALEQKSRENSLKKLLFIPKRKKTTFMLKYCADEHYPATVSTPDDRLHGLKFHPNAYVDHELFSLFSCTEISIEMEMLRPMNKAVSEDVIIFR